MNNVLVIFKTRAQFQLDNQGRLRSNKVIAKINYGFNNMCNVTFKFEDLKLRSILNAINCNIYINTISLDNFTRSKVIHS